MGCRESDADDLLRGIDDDRWAAGLQGVGWMAGGRWWGDVGTE
jgi:hypothetical protein